MTCTVISVPTSTVISVPTCDLCFAFYWCISNFISLLWFGVRIQLQSCPAYNRFHAANSAGNIGMIFRGEFNLHLSYCVCVLSLSTMYILLWIRRCDGPSFVEQQLVLAWEELHFISGLFQPLSKSTSKLSNLAGYFSAVHLV